MYTLLLDVWKHVESMKPSFVSKHPHFNFITVHYFWIIGMAISGSICLYPRSDIKYIDALFLASGSATQSGLNTVDINKLNTWQQLVVYFIPMVTNPITINSFVVFLRLYWFEKRFQRIAKESKRNRQSLARSFTKARSEDRDIGAEERGVGGRSIVVMHHTTRPNGMTNERAVPADLDDQLKIDRAMAQEKYRSSDESGQSSKPRGSERESSEDAPLDRPQLKFADQVRVSNGMHDEHLRLPERRTNAQHIAILQRQRETEDDGAVLRIPGPRDADAGVAPEAVDGEEGAIRPRSRTASTFDSGHHSNDGTRLNGDDHTVDEDLPEPTRRGITIAEPTRSPVASQHIAEHAQAAKHTFGVLRMRIPRIFRHEKLHEDKNHLSKQRSRATTFATVRSALSREKQEGMPYLSWEPTVGRNSAFVDLTDEQREELGGIEYRSLKSLAGILVAYFVGFSLLGVLGLLPWIWKNPRFGAVVTSDGQGRSWWGIFTANSAFTDLGFTLTPDSMISFQEAIWPLFLMSFLIIIGNTGFPIMLRIILWVTTLWVPKDSGIWEELQFLLDHPRRCFTLLFPAKATWALFWILVILNGLDLIFFIILDLGNPIVTGLPVNIRVLDGWFQAASTRTAGFGVVNLAALHPAIQVSYLIMMYISVLPIAISVRRTNVYEEKSLGIYGSPVEEHEDESEPSYVGTHLRRQLSFDLWFIFLGFFIISISEGTRIQSGDPAFTMFTVLFEIVSAYGTVGLSLGYTNINASFSTEFGVIAKLVIIAMQVRGRHRGLPYELDRAILLPSEHLQQKEAEDDLSNIRSRRSSTLTVNRAPVSSGAAKTENGATSNLRSREKSGTRSPTRVQTQNLLSSLLHPGPTIPNSHRNMHNRSHARRHSIAVAPGGRRNSSTRSLSPRSRFGGFARVGSIFGGGDAHHTNTDEAIDDIQEERGRKSEGRRHFFQEGVNSPPRPTVEPIKESGKDI